MKKLGAALLEEAGGRISEVAIPALLARLAGAARQAGQMPA
jgi:hypothetical protein